MRPTFMGFETATRGLGVNQKALDIVGNNLTNIGVTGYTRQRVDLVSLSVNMRYTRFSNNSVPFAGQGAAVYGVSQIRNSFLDKRFREEYADVGYYSVTSSVLEDLSASLDEIDPANMSTMMTKFQDAWDAMLAEGANEATGAANLRAISKQIVQVFRQMSAKLDNVWNQQEYNLQMDVENINSILANVADLNDRIVREKFNSMEGVNENYQVLELLDARNVLLDQLSEYADISYEQQSDGSVTVWMGTKGEDNPPVVQGDKYEQLMMRTNDSDPQFKTVSVFWLGSGKEVNYNSGAVRASLDMLNGRGLAANGAKGETYNQGVLYYKDKVDQFAVTFANAFNRTIEVVDPSSQQPYDPPRYKTLFVFENDSFENASGIRVSDEWDKDATYLITDLKDRIASEDGDKDNTYVAKVLQLFKDPLDFGEFNGSISEYIKFYSVTKLGNDKDFSDNRLKAVNSVSDDLLNQIQQISGVSMEEEGVDMMMYQKAYDAVARLFTTLDDMLEKLINSTGRVGL